MRIFVFEFITGGGILCAPAQAADGIAQPQPPAALLAEGRAMARAVIADLLAIPSATVTTMRDARLAPLHPPGCEVIVAHSADDTRSHFLRLASTADWTLLIAPETGGALLELARLALSAGGRLLSPASALIEIASDKHHTADWLRRHQVPAPAGQIVHHGQSPPGLEVPAVLKPRDGCGSLGVRLIRNRAEFDSALARCDHPLRLERYVTGLAASVAVLCGPAQRVALPACEQRLSSDGYFTYLGGRTPLQPDLDRRARCLALAAVAALPSPLGYIGVDLVLGDNPNGNGDCVIEINPRLTTSYVGLRTACRGNLAAAMLAIAAGQPAALSFHSAPVEFDADGTITQEP